MIAQSEKQLSWWARLAHNTSDAPAVPVFVHLLFVFLYLVLAGNFLYAWLVPSNEIVRSGLLFHFSKSVCTPFWGVFYYDTTGNISSTIPATLFAWASFAITHIALAWSAPAAAEGKFMRLILQLFRFTFYFVATLFVLLIGLRMAVMTYQDLTIGKTQLLIVKPKEK